MQRFSVSVDEDLAEWIESQAAQRGVSKAKIIRDSVETARITGLVQSEASEQQEAGEILDRLEALETRVSALEQGAIDSSQSGTEDILLAFRAQLSDRPPRTEHGEQAVVRTFSLLLEDGPLQTAELKKRLYPEFEDKFSTPDSMWQSIQRYFDEIPGIEKTGRGEYDATPAQVIQRG